jgi:hypothetical protein
MKKALILLSLLIITLTSNSQEIKRRTVTKSSNSSRFTQADSIFQNMSLDSLWKYLIYQRGGCLTGGQIIRDSLFGNNGCVMAGYNIRGFAWNYFFSYPKAELTYFLLDKLADTNKTRIHTCPCYMAKCGEVAVYALHKIYLQNWYDFAPFKAYSTRKMTSCADGPQIWLQDILKDEEQRKVMKECWLGLVE